MGHVIRFTDASGEVRYEEHDARVAAITRIEELVGDDRAGEVRLYRELPLQVRTYVKVEVADDVAPTTPAPPPVRVTPAAPFGSEAVSEPAPDLPPAPEVAWGPAGDDAPTTDAAQTVDDPAPGDDAAAADGPVPGDDAAAADGPDLPSYLDDPPPGVMPLTSSLSVREHVPHDPTDEHDDHPRRPRFGRH